MSKTLLEYCVENGRQELLAQWEDEKNGDLTPKQVTYGSQRKIWWKCQNGHSWQAPVYSRTTYGTGCPYCAHKCAFPGVNSLLDCNPEIAAQWHPEKNGDLTPDQVYYHSHRSVWWRCEKGHEWRALVKSRADGTGCPVCKNRVVLPGVNDLATTNPELLEEWDFEKNKTLSPQRVRAGTNTKAWWVCGNGHSWQASISSRARGNGCPVCSGRVVLENENDFLTAFPAIAHEWNDEKNGLLRPEQVTAYSNRRVWWRCSLGHEYQAQVGGRTHKGTGCPYCAGRKVCVGFNDLKTRYPAVAAQWHPTLNGKLTPEMVTYGSNKKVWWKCKHGHIWKAVVNSRTRGHGCPICAGRTTTPFYDCDPREIERQLLAELANEKDDQNSSI